MKIEYVLTEFENGNQLIWRPKNKKFPFWANCKHFTYGYADVNDAWQVANPEICEFIGDSLKYDDIYSILEGYGIDPNKINIEIVRAHLAGYLNDCLSETLIQAVNEEIKTLIKEDRLVRNYGD